MGGDSISDGSCRPRSVFRDITNQLGKRSLSSISGSSGKKPVENLGAKCVVDNYVDSGKRACLSPQRSVENNPLTENSGSKDPIENKNREISHLGKYNTVTKNLGTSGDTSVLGSVGIGKTSETYEDRASSESTESDFNGYQNDADEHGAENLVISQSGSIDYPRFPESQESQVGLEKCTGLKACEPVTGIDSIKTCSCPFCTKAAYIWLDLHYQDTKGRIAALKKSQKEASILVERSCRGKAPQKYGSAHSSNVYNLESSLWGQWRSLFLHMENIYEREISQLESSLLSLTDLKERCKAELELLNKMAPPEN